MCYLGTIPVVCGLKSVLGVEFFHDYCPNLLYSWKLLIKAPIFEDFKVFCYNFENFILELFLSTVRTKE